MAFDEGLAELLRSELDDLPGITEKKMFGGLCFLQHGHMVCGVHKGGAMFRVGKTRENEALAIEGARPMDFTGRVMGGFVDVSDEAVAEDDARHRWMQMALENVADLPPK